jgi:hypothetical protein
MQDNIDELLDRLDNHIAAIVTNSRPHIIRTMLKRDFAGHEFDKLSYEHGRANQQFIGSLDDGQVVALLAAPDLAAPESDPERRAKELESIQSATPEQNRSQLRYLVDYLVSINVEQEMELIVEVAMTTQGRAALRAEEMVARGDFGEIAALLRAVEPEMTPRKGSSSKG